jgi:transposase
VTEAIQLQCGTSTVSHLFPGVVDGPRGYDGGKKITGRKRHLIVDTIGLLLALTVLPANIADSAGAKPLIQQVVDAHERLGKLWADQSYQADLVDWPNAFEHFARRCCAVILACAKPWRRSARRSISDSARRWRDGPPGGVEGILGRGVGLQYVARAMALRAAPLPLNGVIDA